ncbi:MAG TPA: nucleotidyl transferase AbiEii/AbiGii toxin family protein [Candidatus Paceibacterota bacterium]
MHKEILTKEQLVLLPIVKSFSKNFYLVGGTAIAFHIGHRHSIDFDLFSYESFENSDIRRKIKTISSIDQIIVDHSGEFTFLCNGVKFTFYNYRFDIEHKEYFENVIKIPNLLTLAAMKAFALGQRAKWKDYVDLYFILKNFYSLRNIADKAEEIFGGEFNEKLFRTQLGYFDDVNYAESVEYLLGFKVSEEKIKEELIELSLA